MARERYQIADLTLDVGAVRVTRDDRVVSLPGLSFDLLVALAREAPDVVDSERLIEVVWRQTAVSDETLTQRIALLRRALGDNAADPRYVRSIRGRGYALVPEVVTPSEERQSRWRLPWVVAGVALLLVILSLIAVQMSPGAASPPPPVRTLPTTTDELVARADEYLGRNREVDNDLALELYRRALKMDPDHVGATVGLSFGLSQRVTKFNRPTQEAREALALAEQGLALAPDNAAAHHARAMALDSRGRIAEALVGYRRASTLDPQRVAALSSAAYLLEVKGQLAEALEANLRVAAQPTQSFYHEVQVGSTLAALEFETAAAIWFERANELRPDSVFAAAAFASLRLRQGRLEEAEALARAALDRGIERPELHLLLGHVALMRGNRTEAVRRYRLSEATNPRLGYASNRLLILERRSDAANPELEARYRESIEAIEAGLAEGDEWPGSAIDGVLLHAGFGRLDEAFEALDIGIRLGYRDADWLLLDPMLEELRRHPEFHARVERIRLAVASERETVLAAPWLPPDLLDPSGR